MICFPYYLTSGEEPQMRITVFGATGRIGAAAVQQGLDAGHKVTAVVRESSRFELAHPSLELVRVPGLTEVGPLAPALDGTEAVLSGVGARGRKDGPVASTATRVILEAMWNADVRRIVAVSAAPVGREPEGDSFRNRRLITPFVSAMLRDVYADLSEMEDELRRSGIDWTVVRPPKLTNKAVTGVYRTVIGGNVPRGHLMSRADTAHFMLAALNDPATIGQPVGIAY
jgi:putative NADH-flavin reductase